MCTKLVIVVLGSLFSLWFGFGLHKLLSRPKKTIVSSSKAGGILKVLQLMRPSFTAALWLIIFCGLVLHVDLRIFACGCRHVF